MTLLYVPKQFWHRRSFEGSSLHCPSTRNLYSWFPGKSITVLFHVPSLSLCIGCFFELQLLKSPINRTSWASFASNINVHLLRLVFWFGFPFGMSLLLRPPSFILFPSDSIHANDNLCDCSPHLICRNNPDFPQYVECSEWDVLNSEIDFLTHCQDCLPFTPAKIPTISCSESMKRKQN